MKIGFLHLTDASADHESGVTRYGRLLEQQAVKHPEVVSQAVEVKLTGTASEATRLRQAAHTLSTCDVIHMQFSRYLWGGGWQQWRRLRQFLQAVTAVVVTTIHDIDGEPYPVWQLWSMVWQQNQQQRRYARSSSLALRSTLRQVWQQQLPDSLTLSYLMRQSNLLLTCTQVEAQRLRYVCPGSDQLGLPQRPARLRVIPHFVEEPVIRLSPECAKEQLGLRSHYVITLQGFIHRGKGHRLALEALAYLPETVSLIFAGMATAENQAFLQELKSLARALGVASRLVITGYLDDVTLARYLWASDLALCPFAKMAASGSLSTWIALGRPILAAQLPQIEAYNHLEPGAIAIFTPYTATALAKAIDAQLQAADALLVHQDQALARLRQRLHIAQIFEAHLKVYRTTRPPRLTG